MIKEDLARQLSIFGFTLNQSKIYLAIVEAGSLSVAQISNQTNLHRQDVYQILPKLEENGLITKTLGTPILVNAVPFEKALEELIESKWQNAYQQVLNMQANLKSLTKGLTILRNQKELEEPFFVSLSKENEITNISDMLFENIKNQCDFVANERILAVKAEKWFYRLKIAIEKGAKIRLLINAPSDDKHVKTILNRVCPKGGGFDIKFNAHQHTKPFQVFDKKIVWVYTSKKQPSGWPCVLWSNDRHLAEPYQERFDRLWCEN